MTWREEAEWYRNHVDMTNSANQLNLMGLHTDLSSVGGAFYEMWNGWVKCDWCEQLVELVDEEFFIAGIAEAPYGCWAIDFAIFDSNNVLSHLIEIDGRQHSNDYTPWDNSETLEERQYRDKLKNEYCKNHNIKLIRIPYEKRDTLTLQDLGV